MKRLLQLLLLPVAVLLPASMAAQSVPSSAVADATHTFLVVTDAEGNIKEYFAYGSEYMGLKGTVFGRLKRQNYSQDISIIEGYNKSFLKNRIEIDPPKGMSSEEFDQKVIDVANSFGNHKDIRYFMAPVSMSQGNCNTSTSTILLKSGVSSEQIKQIKKQIPDISTGFSENPHPWTIEEQEAVLEKEKIIKEMHSRSGFGPIHP